MDALVSNVLAGSAGSTSCHEERLATDGAASDTWRLQQQDVEQNWQHDPRRTFESDLQPLELQGQVNLLVVGEGGRACAHSSMPSPGQLAKMNQPMKGADP